MQCPYCDSVLRNQACLMRHVGNHHNGRGVNWRCMWPNCTRRFQTFNSYRTLKRHLNQKHGVYLNAPLRVQNYDDDAGEIFPVLAVPVGRDNNVEEIPEVNFDDLMHIGPDADIEPLYQGPAQDDAIFQAQDHEEQPAGTQIVPLELEPFVPDNTAGPANQVNMFNFRRTDFSQPCGRLLLLNKELLGLSDLSIRNNYLPYMTTFMQELFNHMDQYMQGNLPADDDVNQRQLIHQQVMAFKQHITQGFSKFETRYQFEKFRNDMVHRGDIVAPKQITLAQTTVLSHGLRVEKRHYAHYIPLEDMITMLMKTKDYEQILSQNSRSAPKGWFVDFVDGEYYKNHPLVKSGKKVVIITVYNDEAVMTNNVGNRIIKICFFYFSVVSLHPLLRGKLNSINLLAMAHGSDLRKFGLDAILLDMKNFFNKFGRNGLQVANNGSNYTIFPLLIASLGDTPAQGFIGGTKQASLANCPCRRCMVTRALINTIYREDPLLLRAKEQHEEICVQIDSAVDQVDAEEISFNTGINNRSILSEIKNFDIAQCLLIDVMHTFLEGITKDDLRQCLLHLVNLGLCNILAINDFISKHTFTKIIEKPSPITRDHLKHGLRQTSSQVYSLSIVIPFLIKKVGANINDGGIVENTLRIIKLTHLSLSFVLHEVDVMHMEDEIEKYLIWYTDFFCDERRPLNIKRHTLIHIPNQIRNFGPTRCAWVMRQEAVHQVMKDLTKEINNFINITKSLSTRYIFHRAADSNFYDEKYYSIFQNTTVTSAKPCEVHAIPDIVRRLFNTDNGLISKCFSCTYMHKLFKSQHVIVLNSSDSSVPQLGKILSIFYQKDTDTVVISYEILDIQQYSDAALAYYVKFTGNLGAVNADIVEHPLPCFMYRTSDDEFNYAYVTLQSHRLHKQNDRLQHNQQA